MLNKCFLISAFLGLTLIAHVSVAGEVSIGFNKQTESLNLFDDKPWPNETAEMFNERRQTMVLCGAGSDTKRSNLSDNIYKSVYTCYIDLIKYTSYPLNDYDRGKLKPKAIVNPPKAKPIDKQPPGDYCFNCSKGQK